MIFDKNIISYFSIKIIVIDETNKKRINQYKNNTNEKLIFRMKFITLKDYDELNPYEAIKYDKRSFFILFWDHLINENALFNLLFYRSIVDPLWIRSIIFYLDLSLIFASSAFFFSDNFIDARASLSEGERVNYL